MLYYLLFWNFALCTCNSSLFTDHPLVRDQPELSTSYNQTNGQFLFRCEGVVSAENATQSFVVWSVDGKEVKMSAVNETDDRKFTSDMSYQDLTNFTYGSKVGFHICTATCK